MPRCATISQAPPTTMNGKALRATTRQRASSPASFATGPGVAEEGSVSYMAPAQVRRAFRIDAPAPQGYCSLPHLDKLMAATDPAPAATRPMSAGVSPHRRRSFDELFGVAGEGVPRALARLVAVLALGAAVGACAQQIRMPLPFVLGPLVATAILGIAGWPVVGVRRLRPGAQFVIASAIGIQFTHAIVVRLALLLPLIIGSGFMAIAVCAS